MIIGNILDFIAPYDCLACGQEGKLLCDWCVAEKISPLPSRCYKCRKITRDYAVCENCRPSVRIQNAWITCDYLSGAASLVKKLKYERAKIAANVISQFIIDTLPYFDEDVIVTHVPTATSRRRLRGYDQSELIAKSIAKKVGLQHRTVLARLGQSRQVGAKREKRQKQLDNAFRVCSPSEVKNAKILLVDDVVTTGATLEAAAKTLKAAGAKKIYAAAFAQK